MIQLFEAHVEASQTFHLDLNYRTGFRHYAQTLHWYSIQEFAFYLKSVPYNMLPFVSIYMYMCVFICILSL